VISTDFYPTILAAVGLDLMPDQHKDGLSLMPLLKNPAKILNRDALYFHLPVYHHLNSMGPVGAIRSGDHKLIQRFEEPDNPQLYNLKDGIGEMNDLAKSQPELTATLKAKLEQWQRTTGAVIPSIDELKEIRAKANQSAEAKAARKQNQNKKK
jgi:arylsulfatase A-like enzyme